MITETNAIQQWKPEDCPEFKGWQSDHRGKLIAALFTDPLSGTTFAVRNGQSLNSALAAARERMGVAHAR